MCDPHDQPFDIAGAEPLVTEFFIRDAREVARDLLGCVLASTVDGGVCAGVIVETEAYLGSGDAGSHASTRGITKRNAVMYGPPATAYVYFTYGNHHMLNFVCEPEGVAAAVLIRALEPLVGLDLMTARRGGRPLHRLCDGPGKVAAALGVDLGDNGIALGKGRLQVYAGERRAPGELATSGRVGLSRGHELPYRYYIAGSRFVSKGRTGPRYDKSRRGPDRGGSNS